jgi:formylglycine-generating enzyme required for sulfatase activity
MPNKKEQRLLSDGNLKDKCEESFHYLCDTCGEIFSAQVWKESGNECPACAEGGPVQQGICQLCNCEIEGIDLHWQGGMHPCKSREVFKNSGKVVFDPSGHSDGWEDDPPPVKKRAGRKRVRKTARKSTARKTTSTAEPPTTSTSPEPSSSGSSETPTPKYKIWDIVVSAVMLGFALPQIFSPFLITTGEDAHPEWLQGIFTAGGILGVGIITFIVWAVADDRLKSGMPVKPGAWWVAFLLGCSSLILEKDTFLESFYISFYTDSPSNILADLPKAVNAVNECLFLTIYITWRLRFRLFTISIIILGVLMSFWPMQTTSRSVISEENSNFIPSVKTEIKKRSNYSIKLSEDISPINMIYVKEGKFSMGSPKSENAREDDETQHKVRLTKPFWLSQHEITQEQYEYIMGENPSRFNVGVSNLPVDSVAYWDCLYFCAKLTARAQEEGSLPAGYRYTLPTEAQWEYSCRAGSKTATYNGNITERGSYNSPDIDAIAWYGGNSKVEYEIFEDASKWSEKQVSFDKAGPQPVGLKKPNKWGFFDMIGNVSEWTLDTYEEFTDQKAQDPLIQIDGRGTSDHIIRGGSWSSPVDHCRSARRNRSWFASYGNDNTGFRIALSYDSNYKQNLQMKYTVESEPADINPGENFVLKLYSKNENIEYSREIKFIWVNPGSFYAGSQSAERKKYRSDYHASEPYRKVNIKKGYWLCEVETPIGFKDFVERKILAYDYKDLESANYPKRSIALPNVEGFLHELTAHLGKYGVRLPDGYEWALPTENQWEYACRAGTETAFHFGDDWEDLDEYANIRDINFNTGYGWDKHKENSLNDGYNSEAPVASFKPNQWGFYDMHGNIAEYCRGRDPAIPRQMDIDIWNKIKRRDSMFHQNVLDPQLCVIRGGSYFSTPSSCRSAYRWIYNLESNGSNKEFNVGFRIAVTLNNESDRLNYDESDSQNDSGDFVLNTKVLNNNMTNLQLPWDSYSNLDKTGHLYSMTSHKDGKEIQTYIFKGEYIGSGFAKYRASRQCRMNFRNWFQSNIETLIQADRIYFKSGHRNINIRNEELSNKAEYFLTSLLTTRYFKSDNSDKDLQTNVIIMSLSLYKDNHAPFILMKELAE